MADAASQKAPSASKKSNLGSEVGSSPKAAKKNASAPSQLDGAESHVNGTEKGTQNGTHNGDYEEVSPGFWSSAPRTARDFFSHNVLQPATSLIKTDLPFYSKPKTEPKYKHQMKRKEMKLFRLAASTKMATL